MIYLTAAVAIANTIAFFFWLYIAIRYWNDKEALKKWVG